MMIVHEVIEVFYDAAGDSFSFYVCIFLLIEAARASCGISAHLLDKNRENGAHTAYWLKA